MEETYWKQFMNTGRIEDYLQFKGVFDLCGSKARDENEETVSRKMDRNRQLKERDRLK